MGPGQNSAVRGMVGRGFGVGADRRSGAGLGTRHRARAGRGWPLGDRLRFAALAPLDPRDKMAGSPPPPSPRDALALEAAAGIRSAIKQTPSAVGEGGTRCGGWA